MKQTIIIHGSPGQEEFYDPKTPSPSNAWWIPWLQKQLSMKDEVCQTLEMPKAYDPIYEEWAEVFGQMKINEETVLIGHSCGGGFLVKYLSEHSELKPKNIILVAPWLDPKNELSTKFFDFTINSSLKNVSLFISSDDSETVLESVSQIKNSIPEIDLHEFTERGHFCEPEFPELLELLK